MAEEFFEHSGHRPCYRPPSVQQKETIDPHPNYKYNELTFELRRVPTVIDVCSATRFPDFTSIFPHIQRSEWVRRTTSSDWEHKRPVPIPMTAIIGWFFSE
jgi:hypothetical protein